MLEPGAATGHDSSGGDSRVVGARPSADSPTRRARRGSDRRRRRAWTRARRGVETRSRGATDDALASCVDAGASTTRDATPREDDDDASWTRACGSDCDRAATLMRARGVRRAVGRRAGGVRVRADAGARSGRDEDAVRAYEAHARGVKDFVKAYRADEDAAWTRDAWYVAVDDARALAQRADEALKRGGEKPSKLADAGSTLMLVYRAVSQTSTAEKKAPQLHVVNNLFKVYFKLNALHLCKNLINAVNLPTFLPFDSFPKSEKVTYNFYVGRLAVFEDAYERAAEHLEYAFAHCHAQSARNVRLILQYLIPVKLILGTLPSRKLLEKYELREFVDVVEAMRRGDARTLDAALSER